ncbi:MAG: archaeosortase/exosortase family protein [Chthoniobacteraceae bacterium]
MRLTSASASGTASPLTAVLSIAIAFWPVWVWYWSRVTDGSDEPWGVLALVTVGCILWRQPIPTPAPWQMAGVCVIIIGYLGTSYSTFPLIRAAMAMSALALILARAPSPLGVWTLLLLSLPVVPSLQFFLGYPLRMLVAQTSATILHMGGLAVLREGTALRWAGETVLVDAPCSGLKMVWAGIYFAATLACFRRLGTVSTLILLVATGAVIVAANILRSTLLFFKEAHIIAAPDWTHSAAGLLVFAVAALAIQWLCSRLQRRCVV